MECSTFEEFKLESMRLTNADDDVMIRVFKTNGHRNVKGTLTSYYGLGLRSARIDIKQQGREDVSTTVRLKDITDALYDTELRGFILGNGWTRIGRTRHSARPI